MLKFLFEPRVRVIAVVLVAPGRLTPVRSLWRVPWQLPASLLVSNLPSLPQAADPEARQMRR